jgi:hypothetical protein
LDWMAASNVSLDANIQASIAVSVINCCSITFHDHCSNHKLTTPHLSGFQYKRGSPLDVFPLLTRFWDQITLHTIHRYCLLSPIVSYTGHSSLITHH